MTHMIKGANAPVPAVPLRVAVGRQSEPGAPTLSAAALLLDAAGAVRGDGDVVFHGRPVHPSGAVRHVGTGQGAGQLAEWLEVDLLRVEPDVQRVLIAGSCVGGTFGQVRGLYAQLSTFDGTIVAQYTVTDATTETAFVLGELYRRDGAWRFRAVGQGYEDGLAGLTQDVGGAEAVTAVSPPALVVPPVSPAVPSVPGPVPLAGVGKTGSGVVAPGVPSVPAPDVYRADQVSSGPGPVSDSATYPTSLVSPVSAPAGFVPAYAAGTPAVGTPFEPPPWAADFFAFEPCVYRGKGTKTVTVDLPFPPNGEPVILEARTEEYDFISVKIPGREDDVFLSDLPDHYGRTLMVPNRKGGPLTLKVRNSGAWQLTVLPLSAALPLDFGTIAGSGREVFVRTGPAAELKVRAEDPHKGWFQMHYHWGDSPGDLRRPAKRLVYEWNGRRVREKVVLPSGPIVVTIDKSRHQWELTLDPADPSEPSRGARRSWRR
ncbi:TerD family protein [Streptomyces sp. NBC_00233]|uniref:TerD family protein n=1 Tax=Streptomyces sp. NBC_00233 TaxID=2975686 RepID=UPI00224E93A9|nr:TerD family protein [Streptomyces sp. NBC_00233]MCX5230867.1 TerD family protein [Streptomyces sp. NBC_00233]